MPSKLVRWLPAAVAPVVIAGAVALPVTAAAAAPDLAPKTPAQVLALVAKAKSLDGFSGTVQQRSELGLPEIPSTGAGSDSGTGSALETLTGDHDARVWVSGATRSRIAGRDDPEERDGGRTGSTGWLWAAAEQRATKVTLPARLSAGPRASATTPQEAAEELLQLAGRTTATSVDTAQRVAGRDAYTLVLTPKTDATTIGSVRLAVDAATGLPLRVQVLARGASSPAFEVGFPSIALPPPAAAVCRSTPPRGATVRERRIDPADLPAAPTPSGARPTVTGEGWSAVVEAKADTDGIAANPTVQRLTSPVASGRVLRSPRRNVLRPADVNVLLTDDGRVLAGAVPVARLTAVAAG